MSDDKERDVCLKFLHALKQRGKNYSGFKESLDKLQSYVASKGLNDDDINLLANVIMKTTNLGVTKQVPLIRCLVPRYRVPEITVKTIVIWCLSSIGGLAISVSNSIVQWILGILDHQLTDKKVINIFYGVFFHLLLKYEKLEKNIAHLIYVLAKPEDVTRRDVIRLLYLHQKYAKSRTHIVALLSLFKSYKPELVPERFQSVNIESVWKPIPETLQLMLQNAKARLEVQQAEDINLKCFNWCTLESGKTRKNMEPLLPSVGYFQIGSSIFKEKDTKSIFDISNVEELGKLHLSIELPCKAISLLSNTAGYHLLTFADFEYQSRFSYNLHNTLTRAFMFENDKFSMKDIDRLLDMTVEFSRYMQQGIPVVNHFLDAYLYFNTGEHQSKLLALLQWMTSVPVSDLQEKILVHVQNIFYESTVTTKCEIIKTLKMLITNMFVNQGFEECCQNTPAPFLGQSPMDNLENAISILTKISEDLIVSGLNIHLYNVLLLSEALSFYEDICELENRSIILSFTVAPPAVIYGGFVTKISAILSRICKLLLRYHDVGLQFRKKAENVFEKKMYTISVYIEDIIKALWYDEPFKKKRNKYFLRNVPKEVLKDLERFDLNCRLNISNHHAILPYKYILNIAGFDILTKKVRNNTSLYS
ncbi:Centromere protein I [Habropoda laboriosa]|uniref:Centromere protein I n=1 Tax=Habropoda laboriosa TaxID=597456 RepID=A0A0L7QM56_9HYME|nr:Centromere protein I [Habropoda laboriosa]